MNFRGLIWFLIVFKMWDTHQFFYSSSPLIILHLGIIIDLICSHTMWNWWYVMNIMTIEWNFKGRNLENSGWLAPEFIMTQMIFPIFWRVRNPNQETTFGKSFLKTMDRPNHLEQNHSQVNSLKAVNPSYRHVLKRLNRFNLVQVRFWIFISTRDLEPTESCPKYLI